MKRLLTILTAVLVAGCHTAPQVPEPKIIYVDVPVAVYPSVTIPTRPVLEIDKLHTVASPTPGAIANAYRITIIQLREYAKELESLLQAVNATNEAKQNETK